MLFGKLSKGVETSEEVPRFNEGTVGSKLETSNHTIKPNSTPNHVSQVLKTCMVMSSCAVFRLQNRSGDGPITPGAAVGGSGGHTHPSLRHAGLTHRFGVVLGFGRGGWVDI